MRVSIETWKIILQNYSLKGKKESVLLKKHLLCVYIWTLSVFMLIQVKLRAKKETTFSLLSKLFYLCSMFTIISLLVCNLGATCSSIHKRIEFWNYIYSMFIVPPPFSSNYLVYFLKNYETTKWFTVIDFCLVNA